MTTGLMVSPKTLTSNTLDPDVIRSFAFTLPKKYENLLHLFVSMEKVVSVAHRREMRLTFADVCSNVEKNTKMVFKESHLSQILAVFPKAYDIQWEKHRQAIGKSKQGVKFDLVVKPNLKDDIQSYLLREEPTKRMSGWRLTCRKMVFRHHLVIRVKKAHKKFLFSNQLSMPINHMIHPDFDLNTVPDLSPVQLPQMPKLDVVFRTMRDYLEAISDDEQVKQSKKPSSRGNSELLKEIKQSPKTPVVEHSNQLSRTPVCKDLEQDPETPKQTLLERIRAKENSLKSAKRNMDAEKRNAILQLLKKSMVEVICSHFGLKNVSGMDLLQLMPLVVLSCGQMNKKKFIEHIDVLCEVAPKFCSKDSFLGSTCLKLAEVRADKILQCVDEELKKS